MWLGHASGAAGGGVTGCQLVVESGKLGTVAHTDLMAAKMFMSTVCMPSAALLAQTRSIIHHACV